ncbi:MAG: ROK family protein [Propionibacteriaceae bacterium]|nr:ROK family protein [Propionibacteriaceae bacterium]
MTQLAVDIGGSKIRLTVFDAFVPLFSESVPTGLLRRGTPKFADDLAGLLRCHRVTSHDHLGLTLNGILRGGHVEYSSLMGGRVDFPLQSFLVEQFAIPTSVDDDLHAQASAEAKFGLGRDYPTIAILNLGTGIGAVLADRQQVVRGQFAAGLISEQQVWVDSFQELRSLDRTVCGRGLKEMYAKLTGETIEAVTVFRRWHDNDPAARKIVEVFAHTLGETLQMISRFYHPEAIAIHGSIARSWAVYEEAALQAYHDGLEQVFWAKTVQCSELEYAAELGVLSREAASLEDIP